MATHLGTCASGAPPRYMRLLVHDLKHPVLPAAAGIGSKIPRNRGGLRATVSDGGDSYLDMWRNAVDRERKSIEFQRIVESTAGGGDDDDHGKTNVKELEKKSLEFQKILEVPNDERDRIQRMQVIDRAAAALAAARSILKESTGSNQERESVAVEGGDLKSESGGEKGKREEGMQSGITFVTQQSDTQRNGIPGPDFWSWTPPAASDVPSDAVGGLQTAVKSSAYSSPSNATVEKEQSLQFLSIPFESSLSQSKHSPTLPPLQSSLEVEKMEVLKSNIEAPPLEDEQRCGPLSSGHAAEAVHALNDVDKSSPSGINPDGSRWWKETGIERRPDGVNCRWTMTRGVSADEAVEWQEKFWEAADEFGYKELGSEKSGRDATGNVWREFWRESMWQENGLLQIEKTADKWGKSGKGDEWQENWWEHYDPSGQAEKWAHKWCSIDPNTPLEAGHAHVWHERWGERYDGKGSSIKYTDKWAERLEGDGWEKWGDKWDENFDLNGVGVKQGETWWEGKYGDRWNRTWGEQHNGSGWVHKYGKSSSGEHWDTHVQQDTWYERFPHYGFYHCYENSVQLREVQKPSEIRES